MERHRKAKAHDNEEGSGELGTDFGASKTWLRRRPAKPMGSARVGSNPMGVAVALLAGANVFARATITKPRNSTAIALLSNI